MRHTARAMRSQAHSGRRVDPKSDGISLTAYDSQHGQCSISLATSPGNLLMSDEQARIVDGWTLSPLTGVLSRSVGDWSDRMRIFQKRVGGPFYCSVYLTDGRRHVQSLRTDNPTEAVRLASNVLDTSDGAAHAKCRVPLGRLWERYRTECETFRDMNRPGIAGDSNT
jgi:hypothetical protein